jgi:hypothetical protein
VRAAVESGQRALHELREAERQPDGRASDDASQGTAATAKVTLDRELTWAEDTLRRLRAAASDQAKASFSQHGTDEEKLADRARALAQKGRAGDGALPGDVLDQLDGAEKAMRVARRALEDGDGERALAQQREAQRRLEMARGERDEAEDRREGNEGGRAEGKTDIPGADQHHGPDELRQRIMKGLGRSIDPRLREAVKRYAEGLLK